MYYLRILLFRVCCPKLFVGLKMINGVAVATFRESALLRGYLFDDASQQVYMQEASTFHMPNDFRRLFASLLVFTRLNSPCKLWLLFEDAMIEDLLRYHKETRKEFNAMHLNMLIIFCNE